MAQWPLFPYNLPLAANAAPPNNLFPIIERIKRSGVAVGEGVGGREVEAFGEGGRGGEGKRGARGEGRWGKQQ